MGSSDCLCSSDRHILGILCLPKQPEKWQEKSIKYKNNCYFWWELNSEFHVLMFVKFCTDLTLAVITMPSDKKTLIILMKVTVTRLWRCLQRQNLRQVIWQKPEDRERRGFIGKKENYSTTCSCELYYHYQNPLLDFGVWIVYSWHGILLPELVARKTCKQFTGWKWHYDFRVTSYV